MTRLVPALLVLTGLLGPTPAHPAVWPLDPAHVVARFDPPSSRWSAGHRGVDLRGVPGEPVRAAAEGVVRFVGRIAGRGVVVVEHGGTRTTYEPVTGSVRLGQRLSAGDVIGRLEVFGSHCFPRACLHWGLIEGRDTYLDPLGLVGSGPVRLLPLSASDLAEGSRTARPAAEPAMWVTPRPGQARGCACR